MIGRLLGRLLEKNPTGLLVDVGGVGYEVEVPLSTFAELPETGEELVLHIHMVVREDAQLLYGFESKRERDVFRTLIRVNGVGPRLGLAILSTIAGPDLARLVRDDDVKALTSVPGIGKKTAERLIVELRDRLSEWVEEAGPAGSAAAAPASHAMRDAETALISLGYKPQDAARALAQLEEQDSDVEVLIRQALKALSG